MMIDSRNLVSITEANQNFSRVARLVDERGSAVILKNNIPRYLIVEFPREDAVTEPSDEALLAVSARLIGQNREAYEELSK